VPIVAAIAGIILIAAAISIGQQLGHDVAPLVAIVAPCALALVVWLALYYWHKRRMRELAQGRYDLKHDQLGWRRIVVKPHSRWYICSECGLPCPDLKSSETHSDWHAEQLELAELTDRIASLLNLEQLERDQDEPAWSAVTEESAGVDPDLPDLPDQAQPTPVPTRPNVEAIGEWEAKALAFRRGMQRVLADGRREDDDPSPDA
jgi:hypothetical protein